MTDLALMITVSDEYAPIVPKMTANAALLVFYAHLTPLLMPRGHLPSIAFLASHLAEAMHSIDNNEFADASGSPAGQQEQQIVMIQKQANKFRWKRKAEQRQRRLHQVFLRGDNIVTITPVMHDVERMWSQLVPTWRAAGMADAALPIPASLTAAECKLPLPPPLPPSALPPELCPGKLPLPPPFPPPAGASPARRQHFLPPSGTSPLPPSSAETAVSGAMTLIAPPCPPPLPPTSGVASPSGPQRPLLTASTRDAGPSPAAAQMQPAWPPGWMGDRPAWMKDQR